MEFLSKSCACCEKTFFKAKSVSIVAWGSTKYCSRECYWKDKNKPPSKICPSCGKAFKSKIWSTKAKYCSQKCAHIPAQKPLPLCQLCEKPCKKHGRRFCSHACKVEWYRGEEVYNYMGGQARDHYASSFWLKLADEIRQRDKVCQRCGKLPKPGRKLHVHHKNPWRFSKDDSPENLQALCPSCHKKADHELFSKVLQT